MNKKLKGIKIKKRQLIETKIRKVNLYGQKKKY